MPKTVTKLVEAIHIDDFMEFKREIRNEVSRLDTRLDKAESHQGDLEDAMDKMNQSISTMNKAILGDMEHPDQPGMAENLRSLRTDVSRLVEMHNEEQQRKPLLENLSWKAILIALGTISTLGAVIFKLLEYITKPTIGN